MTIFEQVLRFTDLYFQGGEGVQKVVKSAFKLRLKDKHNIWMVPYLIQKSKELHVRCAIVLYTSNFFYVDQV